MARQRGDRRPDAEPIDAVPIDAVPIDAVPIDAVPIDAVPIDAVPIDAVPIDAEPIDAVPIEELMVSLQRLGRLLASRQVATRISTAAGVDVSQQGAALLRVLLREGELSVAALAAATPMEIAAVSRQVRQLEAAGAITRATSPDDARVTLIELTPAGRELAEKIRAVGVRHLQEALGAWSTTEQRRLATLMRRLVDDLRSTPVRPGFPAAG